jgi:hypothetical protein
MPVVPSIPRSDSPAASPLEEALRSGDVEAFVGRNAEVYRAKWTKIAEKARASGSAWQVTWHWPAFFAGVFWMVYRRMYGYAGLLFLLIAAWVVVDLATGANSSAASIGLQVVVGMFANALYLRRFQDALGEAGRAAGPAERETILRSAGGTSPGAVVVAIVAYVVLVFAAAALVAFSAR